MVIKPVNASMTKGAMAASRSSDNFAVRTKTAGFKVLQKFSEVHIWIFLDITRVTKCDYNAKKKREAKERIACIEKPFICAFYS